GQHRLAGPGHVLEEHVPPGCHAGEDALDHELLAEDDALDVLEDAPVLLVDLAQRQAQVAAGRYRRGRFHQVPPDDGTGSAAGAKKIDLSLSRNRRARVRWRSSYRWIHSTRSCSGMPHAFA